MSIEKGLFMRLARVFAIGYCVTVLGCSGAAVAQPNPAVRNDSPAGNVTLARYVSLSPDGTTVAFSWHGDLWKVDAAGGAAYRLTTGPGDESSSRFSPDGKSIAFISNLDGGVNLYVIDADGTNLRQITRGERAMSLGGWTVLNGEPVLLISTRTDSDVYPGLRPMAMPLKGGEPIRLHDAFGSEPSLASDGRVLFTRGGGSWLRRGYVGSDSKDIWIYNASAGERFRRLTDRPGNDGLPRWLPEGSFCFVSDRANNTNNLFLAQPTGTEAAKAITTFTGDGVDSYDVSADGKIIALSRNGRLMVGSIDAVRAIVVDAPEDPADRIELKDVSRAATEAAMNPDGKSVAVIAYGQVYVRPTQGKASARRVTTGPTRATDLAWSPDGSRLYFTTRDAQLVEQITEARVSLTRELVRKKLAPVTQPASDATTEPTTDSASQPTSEPTSQPASQPTSRPADPRHDPAAWADAVRFELNIVSQSPDGDSLPKPSPDGKTLAIRRGVGKLVLVDLATKTDRVLFEGWSESLEAVWSPDSRRIVYVTEDRNNNADLWMIDADGKAPAINLTRHPDNDYSPRFSADGKLLAFLSQRKDNEPDVYTVWLDSAMEAATPAELETYFKDANAVAKKRQPPKPSTQPSTQPATRRTRRAATRPDDREALDTAYLRLRRLTSMLGQEGGLLVAPAGDKFYFTASTAGPRALYQINYEGGEPKRLAAGVSPQELSLGGDQLLAISSGQAAILKLPTAEPEALDVSDKLVLDRREQAGLRFLEAARVMQTQYYDAAMHGVDWPAIVKHYLPIAQDCRTADEFDWVFTKVLGELNSSHTGIDSPEPASAVRRPVGKLGVEVRRAEGGLRVEKVLRMGPAGLGTMKLIAGDILTSIEFKPIADTDTLDALLAGRVGVETVVTVQRDGNEIELLLTPISTQALTLVTYDQWRLDNAAMVDKRSGGKLGYIHIRGMDQGSLDIFERDLYAAAMDKSGLIVDVRNNGGGWTADRFLASITAPRHAYTISRGAPASDRDAYPQDRLFIQRYDLPMSMLCNEKSFSNAEIVSHAFKTLKRGTLVGQQTAGGVISTGAATLLDGTTIRTPGRGWYTPDGTDMENHGATPDLLVPQTPEDEAADNDAQLMAAVDELLKRAATTQPTSR